MHYYLEPDFGNPAVCALRKFLNIIASAYDREEAITLARTYLTQETEQHPLVLDYLRILNSPTEYDACWYFDYRYHYPDHLPEKSRDMIGTAPGFTISKKEQQIQVISWSALYDLNQLPHQF